MKRTLSVNIGGMAFFIDEDAYGALKKYLDSIGLASNSLEGGNEIFEDVEIRIAELFAEKLKNNKQVITLRDVEEVKSILGEPEDFSGKDTGQRDSYNQQNYARRMYRDPDSRVIGGVCSGLAAYWSTDVSIIRIIFILLAIFGMFGVFIYLVLWIVLPEANTIAQKLEMRGEPVNLSNIAAFFRKEFENVKRNFRKK
ncbi:MAG: PspC domain-containing protein [Bacteroidales bacterium]|nr:PspC domain-containing protein [Bacteroidales bacterium]